MLKIRLILAVTIFLLIVKDSIFGVINLIDLLVKAISISSGVLLFGTITIFAFSNSSTMEYLISSHPLETLKEIAQFFMTLYLVIIPVSMWYCMMKIKNSEHLIDEYKKSWDKYKSDKDQILAKANIQS